LFLYHFDLLAAVDPNVLDMGNCTFQLVRVAFAFMMMINLTFCFCSHGFNILAILFCSIFCLKSKHHLENLWRLQIKFGIGEVLLKTCCSLVLVNIPINADLCSSYYESLLVFHTG